MNRRERRRLEIFSRVKQGLISVSEAGRFLAVSERQARRIWKRYKQDGDMGLVHALRGRKSNACKATLPAAAGGGEVKPAALRGGSLRSPPLRCAGLTSPQGVTLLLKRVPVTFLLKQYTHGPCLGVGVW